jgi:hypothetical protein
LSIQLRTAIEKVRQCYIEKLLEAGIFKGADRQLYHLTLSELASMARKISAEK